LARGPAFFAKAGGKPSFPVEEFGFMMTHELCLSFLCCSCSCSVNVKLHCEGAGLATETPLVAALIGCPTCGENNQIVFSTNGQLHRVDRRGRRLGLPQPSLN
jgi:hypothetical protein